MEYFLYAMTTITVLVAFVATLGFHVWQANHWREERAYLLNVAVSKDATDFSRRVNPVPANGPAVSNAPTFWDTVDGFTEPVGM